MRKNDEKGTADGIFGGRFETGDEEGKENPEKYKLISCITYTIHIWILVGQYGDNIWFGFCHWM